MVPQATVAAMASPDPVNDQIDSLLRDGVERGAVPGVVAVVVDGDGVRYDGAFGERELGGDVAMTVDTVGAIFSMTKAITAAAAMQLVERGQLAARRPSERRVPRTRRPAGPVRLRQRRPTAPSSGRVGADAAPTAHAHRGFGYELFNSDLVRWHEVTGTAGLAANGPEMLDGAARVRPRDPVGVRDRSRLGRAS